MYDVTVKDMIMSSKLLRDRLGIDDVIIVMQQNSLRWYGHVLRKDEN